MKNRHQRLEALRTILTTSQTGRQMDILAALHKYGFDVTQATLSRDLQSIRAAKIADGDSVRYALPGTPQYRHIPTLAAQPEHARNNAFTGLDFSGNLCVIHTRPSLAPSIAYDIDHAHLSTIIGTVAGDDTVIAVIRAGATEQQVMAEIEALIPAATR